MNYMLVCLAFIGFATVYVDAQVRAYNVSVFLGGKKFDRVSGKLKLNLIGNVFKYTVPLSANTQDLQYNKVYNYSFAAPHPIDNINSVALLWSRKTTVGSLFKKNKIYVTQVVLEPAYIADPITRRYAIRRYCPLKSADGIKPSEEAILRRNC